MLLQSVPASAATRAAYRPQGFRKKPSETGGVYLQRSASGEGGEAMALLAELPVKESYDRNDVAAMLDQGFDRGILCARLFLMMSKDSMTTALTEKLPTGGIGAKRYKA